MISQKTCTAANTLIAGAVLAWVAYAALAVWPLEMVPRHAALGLAGAMTVLALAVNGRQTVAGATRALSVAVEKAPRDQYWRGYQDRGSDATARDLDDEPRGLDG